MGFMPLKRFTVIKFTFASLIMLLLDVLIGIRTISKSYLILQKHLFTFGNIWLIKMTTKHINRLYPEILFDSGYSE